jgi:alpha-2-macroglobulin
MVEAKEVGPTRAAPVVFDPPQRGSFEWTSPTQLTFKPAAGSLNWGHRIKASIQGLPVSWVATFDVPPFQAAGKVASWPVIDGRPRWVAFLPGDAEAIGNAPLLSLYDQPVEPRKLAKKVTATDSHGKSLRVRVTRPETAEPIFDGDVDLAHLIAVSLVDTLPQGEPIVLVLPSADEAGVNTEAHPLLVNRELSLTTRLEEGDAKRAPLDSQWTLEFSNAVRSQAVEDRVRIEPEPEDVQVSSWGREVKVHAVLAPGVRYRMTVPADVTDVLGNRLGKDSVVSFRSQDLAPMLDMPKGPLLLERDRPRVPIRVRNLGPVAAEIFPLESVSAYARAGKDGENPCDATPLHGGRAIAPVRLRAKVNVDETLDLPLNAQGIRGLACVRTTAVGRGSESESHVLTASVLVQVTDLGITAKVFSGHVFTWVTRLRDAKPVKGAKLVLLDGVGNTVSRATTGEDGVAELAAKDLATGAGVEQKLFVLAQAREDAAMLELDEERLSQAWQFGLSGEVKGAIPLPASVFTDRGAYRPGETVHVKVIVTGKAEPKVAVQVQDPRGQEAFSRTLTLDPFSAADADVELKPQAPVGEYSLRVTRGERFTVRHFRVEEYRVPTFEVAVKSPEWSWSRSDEIHATVEARYLHGGALGNREVRWEVLRDRVPFSPAGFPQYAFSLPDFAAPVGQVANGEGKLEATGSLTLSFRADHPAQAGPMRYVVEASVTDLDRQAYAGRISKVVHPADFYVGLRPPGRNVLVAGTTLEVPVVAVRPDGTPVEGVEIRAELERVDSHTTARLAGTGVQLLNHPVVAEGEQCLVTTTKTATLCRFALSEAGSYRARAWAEDLHHQVVQAGFDVTVAGDNSVAWPRFDQDRVELIADKAGYEPGDVAHLVVQTPFTKATGLLTLERDRVVEHRIFTIDGDTPRLDVPLSAGLAPNVFASVVLLRGRTHFDKDATGFETGAPAFKIGYANLPVDPTGHRLAVQVTPGSLVAGPKEPLQIDVVVRDSAGKPSSGQATLMVVDEAVLGLTGYATPAPVAELFSPRALGIRTAESRLELPDARRARREQIFAGGDGEEGFRLQMLNSDLRNLFKSTAYWNPRVPVDENGTARVTVNLPDNLSAFRIMAVVVDKNGRAGSSDRKVVVRKPLMVQPVLPRFAYPDDQFVAEAMVFNGTAESGSVAVEARFRGLENRGPLHQQLEIKAGETGTFRFPVTVTGRDNAMARFSAQLGKKTDAVEVSLPLPNPGSKRVEVASANVSGEGTLTVHLPADRQPKTAEVEVMLSSTALTELKDAVGYLMDYPNGCIEQTTSTAYPLVVLRDLLPDMGVTVNEADLKKFSEAGIRSLLSFQTPAGGLSYWPGSDKPHAFGTAFGATALIEGKKRGYDVPDEALKRIADYLESKLREGTISEEMPHEAMADGDTRAFIVMTLGRLGRPQPAYISALWREKSKLTAFGLSFLATSVEESKDTSLLQPILAEVRRVAKENDKEAWYEGHPEGGWSMGSPIRTHAAALLAFADSGDTEMGAKFLAGLLARRQPGWGIWGNTQENVFGVMGVARMVGSPRAGGRPVQAEVTVDGKHFTVDQMEAVSPRVRRLTLAENDLALTPGKQQTRSFTVKTPSLTIATVRSRYEVVLNEHNRAGRSNGYEVSRRYETVDGKSLSEGPIPLGSVVRIRISVKANAKNNYVAVEDHLPAGLEPMNTELATTEKMGAGPITPEIERGLALLSYRELRDARVAFYVDEMPAGSYEFVYLARATTPGHFLRPAAGAEAMYRPEIAGSTAIDDVEIQ